MEATATATLFTANSEEDTDSDSDVLSFDSDTSADSDYDDSPSACRWTVENTLIHTVLNKMPEDDHGIGRYRIPSRPGVVGSCPQNTNNQRRTAAAHLSSRRWQHSDEQTLPH